MRNNFEFFSFINLSLVILQMFAQNHVLYGIAPHTDKMVIVAGVNFIMGGFAWESYAANDVICRQKNQFAINCRPINFKTLTDQ